MLNKKKIIKKSAEKSFPEEFPFWARLRISKNRTTLVIDEDLAKDKKKNKMVKGYVHREATSTANKKYEKIEPNPDRSKIHLCILRVWISYLGRCLSFIIKI